MNTVETRNHANHGKCVHDIGYTSELHPEKSIQKISENQSNQFHQKNFLNFLKKIICHKNGHETIFCIIFTCISDIVK